MNEKCSIKNLVFLALFHTIGFFRADAFFEDLSLKTDIDYFSNSREVKSKYIFGCYYLEYRLL